MERATPASFVKEHKPLGHVGEGGGGAEPARAYDGSEGLNSVAPAAGYVRSPPSRPF